MGSQPQKHWLSYWWPFFAIFGVGGPLILVVFIADRAESERFRQTFESVSISDAYAHIDEAGIGSWLGPSWRRSLAEDYLAHRRSGWSRERAIDAIRKRDTEEVQHRLLSEFPRR